MFTVLIPLLLSALAGVGAWYWGVYPALTDPSIISSFGGSIASVGTTMLGFMLAALAVLASINHTHLVTMMRTTCHYHDLLVTLFTGCFLFLACAIGGFLVLFGVAPKPIFMSFLVGVHAGALISLLDIGRKFWLVLSNLHTAPS